MKKLINKNAIFTFILGVVITSLVSVYANQTNIIGSSSIVSYNPKDSDFNASDVKSALDKLYDYHKHIENMSSSDCISGTYYHNANTHWSIYIGFKPTKAYFNFIVSDIGEYHYSYDSRVSNKVLYVINLNNGSFNSGDSTSYFDIDKSIITSTPTTGSFYKKEYNVNYMVCK